ncbi:MAG: Mth938-like domain-containing protein [Rhodocyclaceae bacterium]
MKLHAASLSTAHAVTGYGDRHVSIDGRELRRSLLLLPDHLDQDWGPDDFTALARAHLEPLATLRCDVLLLGTGSRQRFPSPALLRPLIEAGRNIEVMDTQSACRTYNILMTEGRVVAAALIIEISSAP